MKFTDIGVYVENERHLDDRIDIAVKLAARQEASVTGLFVSVDFDKHEIFGLPISRPDVAKYHTDRVRQSQLMQAALEKAGQLEGVPVAWRFEHDSLRASLLAQALRSDLMVVGTQDLDSMTGVANVRLPDCLALESGRAVLTVAPGAVSTPIGHRVLVAWRPGREAVRAMSDALPILRAADHVEILVVTTQESSASGESARLDDIGHYLESHAVNFTTNLVASDGRPVAECISNRVSEGGFDMVVMGAYGRPRALQNRIGGVSEEMLRNSPVPVLMSH